jgi:predicted DNA binding CopG/RHH family protein
MRETYDFSNARKNPYSKKLKKSITIRVDEDALDYFKGLAGNIEVPYQTLINLYLKDCASHHRKLELNWK